MPRIRASVIGDLPQEVENGASEHVIAVAGAGDIDDCGMRHVFDEFGDGLVRNNV